jgi:broad specificity phosphatase PhoE
MPYLILIRHSTSQPVPGQSAHGWQLTPEAHERVADMATKLREYNIAHVYTSAEPKIEATGKLLSSALDVPCDIAAELHETLRETAPYYEDIEVFWAAIQAAMAQPDELLFGEETFDDAYDRMVRCIDGLLAAHPGQTIAAVTGGVTLALVVSRKTGQDVYKIWRSLKMPSYAVLSLPDYELVELVTEMN